MTAWFLLLAGCNDQNFKEVHLDAIAVVLGDFDHVSAPLFSMDIVIEEYDGFIVQATYEPEDDRTIRETMALSVEGLLTDVDDENKLEINRYNAVFVNSGTRGLGVGQYNNTLIPDELVDPAASYETVCGFVEAGGTLVVSDWAYDLVESCWPDAIEFQGDADGGGVDAAQTGVTDTDVTAYVSDDAIAEALGTSLSLSYNYSAWAVVADAASDTEVLLYGSVEYQPAADELYQSLTDAPLLVRFPVNRGSVIFSTFHWSAQNPAVAQALLLATIAGLEAGTPSDGDDGE